MLDRPTVFVSVASYRDSQCQYTLQDLFAKARHPERIFVGVCFQVAESDHDCFLLDLDSWAHQIRTYFLPHLEAKGPCYARALIQQKLLRDEDYYLQIDSHFRFVVGWDEILLEQLAACPSPKPVLTTLANAYELPRNHQAGVPDDAILSRRDATTILCSDKFGDECAGQDDAFLRIKSRVCRTDFCHRPPPALFWTARLHFSRTEAVRDCPYDPHLDYIFFGEEISMAARLFTQGWDLFNMTKTIGYHLQSRFHRPFYTEVQISNLSVRRHSYAKGRLYALLGDVRNASAEGVSGPPVPPYGLGQVRTLQEYENFCGVSFRDHTISDHARRGGISPAFLAPAWAEEIRDQLLSTKCFVDPEVWAGRGNTEALGRQFPELLVRRELDPELSSCRDSAKLKVQGLREHSHEPEALLDLSRHCAYLGRAEERMENRKDACKAYEDALRFAEMALTMASENGNHSCLWQGFIAHAKAVAYCGLCDFQEGKAAIGEALAFITEALQNQEETSVEVLALDIVSALHRLYEQTDDKIGLRYHVRQLESLLGNLRARHAASQHLDARKPFPMISVEASPQHQEESIRAKLLEVVLLLFVVLQTDEGDAAARRLLIDFASEVRESPRLLRQLGILQAGGMFLDLTDEIMMYSCVD